MGASYLAARESAGFLLQSRKRGQVRQAEGGAAVFPSSPKPGEGIGRLAERNIKLR
jgi:hypothetical protein